MCIAALIDHSMVLATPTASEVARRRGGIIARLKISIMDLRQPKTIKRELERTVAHARELRQKLEDGDHEFGVVVPGCQRPNTTWCISIPFCFLFNSNNEGIGEGGELVFLVVRWGNFSDVL